MPLVPEGPAFWAIAVVAAYKGACLLVGLAFGYMGYRLFLAGIVGAAGDLKAAAGERALELRRAAPGTFFALFGAAVIAATVLQGFDVELPGPARHALERLPEHPPMVSEDASR